ncbi:hypothetical protein [Streptococcus dysgalactiae]|uniref:hypothetical protein n=1 Tax=Streptococcus dysgalactiae TaxID=1334 RepID=UPI0016530F01|nr:hypothetical protein [Streptococcus dysgalactiae]
MTNQRERGRGGKERRREKGGKELERSCENKSVGYWRIKCEDDKKVTCGRG